MRQTGTGDWISGNTYIYNYNIIYNYTLSKLSQQQLNNFDMGKLHDPIIISVYKLVRYRDYVHDDIIQTFNEFVSHPYCI